jgi:hypothetical protein
VTTILAPLGDQLDVILDLLGPDGAKLVTLDESFTGDPELLSGQSEGFPLPVTGQYTIVVRGFSGHGGRYTLSLEEGGHGIGTMYEAGELAYGEAAQETLRSDEVHAWYLNGHAGDRVTLSLRPLEGHLDLEMVVLRADDESDQLTELVVVDDFLDGEREFLEMTLPEDALYVILVRDYDGETGSYEIESALLNGPD